MNFDTNTLRTRLAVIESKIEGAEQRARAENDLFVTIGHGGRFTGCGRELEELKSERRDIQSKLRGLALSARMDELTALDVEIARLGDQRTNARAAVERQKAQPVIQRWLQAPMVAASAGVGHAFEVVRPWLLSMKPRYKAPIQVQAMDEPSWPIALRFTEAEREAIFRFVQSQDELQRIEAAWSSAMAQRQSLLRDTPELQ